MRLIHKLINQSDMAVALLLPFEQHKQDKDTRNSVRGQDSILRWVSAEETTSHDCKKFSRSLQLVVFKQAEVNSILIYETLQLCCSEDNVA